MNMEQFVKGTLADTQEVITDFVKNTNFEAKDYQFALAFIAFNPTFWNIVARLEYKTHFLTKITGSAKRGCYLLAVTIFSLGIARDYFYEAALRSQPTSAYLLSDSVKYFGMFYIGFGQLLVVTSMYALGVTGTYLGDYFGILMDYRVTAFPFNIFDNPMYQGSAMSFLGYALYNGKPAGLFAALFVHVMYSIALKFEEPFTAMIYAKRDEARAGKKDN